MNLIEKLPEKSEMFQVKMMKHGEGTKVIVFSRTDKLIPFQTSDKLNGVCDKDLNVLACGNFSFHGITQDEKAIFKNNGEWFTVNEFGNYEETSTGLIPLL